MSLSSILFFAINSVMPIILLVALGYLLKRAGLFTGEFLRVANRTVFRVLLPVLLFMNLAQMDNFSQLSPGIFLYVVGIIALLFFAGLLLARATSDYRQKGVLLQCVFRSNFALIGVPLAQLMAGSKGVQSAAMLSAFTIPLFNVLSVVALSAYTKDKSNAKDRLRKVLLNILHNPLLWGVLAGVVFVCLKPAFAALPEGFSEFAGQFQFVRTALTYLSNASTPVALLVLGGQFELSHVGSLRRQIAVGVSARLILAPLLGLGGAILLHRLGILRFSSGIFAALVALFGTPVAVASAIMAEEMDNDGQLAAQLVVWTTLLSAFVIFVCIVILRAMQLL